LPRRSAVLRAQERVFWRNRPEGRKSRYYLEKTGPPAKSSQQKTINIQHIAISISQKARSIQQIASSIQHSAFSI